MGAVLEVKNLSVSFDMSDRKKEAVKNVSFSVCKEKVLAIVGESGCGKSVTCKSVMGLLPKNAVIESGEILFCGKDILLMSENEKANMRRKTVSIVTQNPATSLNPSISVGKQIQEAVVLREKMDGRISKYEAYNRTIELMQMVGLDDCEKVYKMRPHRLSGGMRQRVVIAIALATKPDVLIADEPTSALDVSVQKKIVELFNEIKQKLHMAIVLVTHDFGVVANIADRVIVMKSGEFVEEGRVDVVLSNPQDEYTKQMIESLPSVIKYDGEVE